MALMEMVTRRGTFLDLGQMDQTEFRAWWIDKEHRFISTDMKGEAAL